MILIVEDHADTRDALVKFLRAHEFNTMEARDGEEALAVMKSQVPYLVVLDWYMPNKSGLDVIYEMRKDARLKDTAVIFYTGYADPALKRDALNAGARNVLVKGSNWEDLLEEIAELTSVRPELYQN